MVRNKTLDYAKGIAIILMVIGHCYSTDNPVLTLIYGFHMPLFFMISGIIYGLKCKDATFRFHYWKTAKRYLIPYFLYEFLYIALVFVLSFRSGEAVDAAFGRMRATARFIGCTVTWYLPCLLIVETLFFLLYGFIKKLPGKSGQWLVWILPVVSYGAALLLPRDGMWIVLARAFVGLTFFSMGFVITQYFPGKIRILSGGGYCLLLLTAYIVLTLKNGMVSLVGMKLENPVLYMLHSTLGSLVFLAGVQLLTDRISGCKIMNDVLLTMGKNTLLILGTHLLLIEITRVLEYKLLNNAFHRLGWVEGIVYGTLICALELLLIEAMKKGRAVLTRGKRVD